MTQEEKKSPILLYWRNEIWKIWSRFLNLWALWRLLYRDRRAKIEMTKSTVIYDNLVLAPVCMCPLWGLLCLLFAQPFQTVCAVFDVEQMSEFF